MDKNKEKSEKLLLEITKQKEEADKMLLALEIVIGVFSLIILFGAVLAAALFEMRIWLRVIITAAGFALFIIGMIFALKIEQKAGYYECAECGHKYVPSYKSVLIAPHFGRTRKMRCPKCGKKSWNKKALKKVKEAC